MSGQVQFNGMVPFFDRSRNATVNVQVWGAFVGHGVDGHEVSSIQAGILNALAESARAYDGRIEDLPAKAQEWGNWVSQQIAPQLAQQFQAQGHLQIHGVSLEPHGAPGAQPQKMMAAAAPAGGAGGIEQAAQALVQKMGVPIDQARQAAGIVASILGAGGGVVANTAAEKQAMMKNQQGYGYEKQGYEKQGYEKQGHACLLYTSPSPRDGLLSRMPSSA